MFSQPPCTYKLITIGDGACGKTSILSVYKNNEFPRAHIPTVLDNFSLFEHCSNGERIEISIWDTAGQEDYERIRELTYPGTDVVLLIYSIDLPSSLENVELLWARELKRKIPETPIILVGNKTDLRENERYNGRRLVRREEGEEMARKIGAKCFLECSALANAGLDEIFDSVMEYLGGREDSGGRRWLCC